MPIINAALAHLIIIVIIGIVAGLVFNRYGQGWFARNIGWIRHADTTTALVAAGQSLIPTTMLLAQSASALWASPTGVERERFEHGLPRAKPRPQ